MNNIALSLEDLGKRYRIGATEKKGENAGSVIRSFLGSPFSYLQSRFREPNAQEIFWALKDVSFEVKHGEVLGIIGRNGAGKSTLLKILSRITEPTTGRANVYGRIGSLLEVGTGFHPELTGRENIYLNGAILGMCRAEIDRKFDEIVDFSEIEKFIDTPVKRYSSGMYVRLAFAVAAHLEPEILLIDEVLAVGDVAFQNKCLGKMKNVAHEGRTVLFVSHNMGAVQHLCNRLILLQEGSLVEQGDPEKVVNQYFQLIQKDLYRDTSVAEAPRRDGLGEKIRFLRCWLEDGEQQIALQYKEGDLITVCLELEAFEQDYDDIYVNVGINTLQQVRVLTVTTRKTYGCFQCPKNRKISVKASFDNLSLTAGSCYNLTITAGRRGRPLDSVEFVSPFDVLEHTHDQTIYHPKLWGIIQSDASWRIGQS